jgi:hypothetical protein
VITIRPAAEADGYTQIHRARQDGFDRVFFRKQLGA